MTERQRGRLRASRPLVTAVAALAFVAAVAVVAGRTYDRLVVPGRPDAPAWGMVDFRDAVYYPVVAFLDGNDPYDPAAYAATYPVGNVFPFYTPLTLLVHSPFGLLPLLPAAAAYFVLSVALVVVLSYLTLRMCGLEPTAAALFALAAAIVISQPGQWNLFLGQCGATIAVGTYGATYLARSRPWLAGLCLAVAAIKPTAGVPLALLMFARGDRAAALVGAAVGLVVGGLVLAPIVWGAGGVGAFVTAVSGNYAGFTADPSAAAATSPYRVDVAALASRLLGRSVGLGVELVCMALVLGLAALALHRLAARVDEDDARGLGTSLVCVAVLVCVYHQSYEALLLAFPIVWAGRRCFAAGASAAPRAWVLLGALVVPAFNYLVMGGVVSRMPTGSAPWLAATCLDGAALLVAFGVLCAMVRRPEAP